MTGIASYARRFGVLWAVAALSLALLILLMQRYDASATHQPADKIGVSGQTAEVLGSGEQSTLLKSTLRTSSPTDLMFQVTAECAITTELTTVGNDRAAAFGQVRMWVLLDGKAVPVATGDSDGKVVFCNRSDQRETSMFDDEDATIKTFQQTRQANAFNWIKLNLGSGVHTIEVRAELTQTSEGNNASAMAAVGKRTLIVEPAKLANDATL